MGQCQAAVAEAVEVFGKVDILLCCSSEGRPLYELLEHAESTDWVSSAGRHRRRARSFSEDTDSRPGTVRDQLLWACQLYQGHITGNAEKVQRTRHDTDRYKSVYISARGV